MTNQTNEGNLAVTADLAVRPTLSELSIKPNQAAFDAKQVAALRALGVKDASPADLAVYFHVAARSGLDPFSRQIYMLARWSKEGPKQTIQTGIDGYRLIARRASQLSREPLSYDDTLWCGHDGVWTDVWLVDEEPAACKLTIYRGESRFSAVALWREYVQTNKDGSPNSMWARMRANQLAKCAEAAVLRKAFPLDLSGIYIDEEMDIPADTQRPPIRLAPAPTSTPPTRMSRAKKPPPPEPVDPLSHTIDAEIEEAPALPEGMAPAPDPDQLTMDVELPEPDVTLGDPFAAATDKQIVKLQILLKEKGYRTRAAALAYVNSFGFATDVTSSKELYRSEASTVIDALEELDDAGE